MVSSRQTSLGLSRHSLIVVVIYVVFVSIGTIVEARLVHQLGRLEMPPRAYRLVPGGKPGKVCEQACRALLHPDLNGLPGVVTFLGLVPSPPLFRLLLVELGSVPE